MTSGSNTGLRIFALSGGVGGAKLVCGLAALLDPGELLVVANTGDDFEHLGLRISPDIDSLLYALAGLNDCARGWSRGDESWNSWRPPNTSLGQGSGGSLTLGRLVRD